jgi:hypothetical protein
MEGEGAHCWTDGGGTKPFLCIHVRSSKGNLLLLGCCLVDGW